MRGIPGQTLGGLLSALLLLAPAAAQTRPAARAGGPEVKLARRVARLDNGLTLLMQPDAAMAVVGVEFWIRGGYREEAPGQFGVAHLFEHYLPTSGRFLRNPENRALYSRAARNSNAGTEPDFIRFYAESTPEGLEALLGMLADRLESDPKGFTAERLKRDQDIVVNELRKSVGTEWDMEVFDLLQKGTFGREHPYGHAGGGNEAQVRAATPELMLDWHARFAGAANALVLISGAFDPDAAEAAVRRHFGPVRPGEPLTRPTEWTPRARSLREVFEKDARQGAVYLRWPVPSWGSEAGDHLGLFARVLARRAERRAAEAGATALSPRAEVELWELAGAFTLRGSFAAPADAAAAEGLLRGELERLLREGPTPAELSAAKAQSAAEFVRRLQQPAWRGGRTDVLGMGLLYRGDPDLYRARLARTAAATPEAVARDARRWLAEPGYVLHVLPKPALKAAAPADRGATVKAAAAGPASFPEPREASLPNGMRLLVAERPQLPLVHLTLAFDAGSATDAAATAGRARVALKALTRQRTAPGGPALRDELEELGARLDERLDEDSAALSVSVLSDRLDEAARLLGAALARGVSDAAVAEARREALAELDAALKEPLRLRVRALTCALAEAGACNPGALDGLGTRAGLERLTTDDVRRFQAERYRPANALLLVSGDVTRERAAALLGRSFGAAPSARVSAPAPAPAKAVASALPPAGALPAGGTARPGGFVLVDNPGSPQAHLLLVMRLPAAAAADPLRAEVLARALRTRLMDNLRAAKGWSYEVYPFGVEQRARGPLMNFNIPLQLDKTAESIAEIRAELRRLREEPVTAEFLEGAKNYTEGGVVTAPLTSLERMNSRLLELARSGRPLNYYAGAGRGLRALTAAQLAEAAREMLDEGRLVWVIAGDRAAVERELREAGVEFSVYGAGEAR